MTLSLAAVSLMLLCLSMAAAVGGGLFEHVVLVPIWRKSPPSSFAIIQPGTGVPLQRFWIPVHICITVFIALSFVAAWNAAAARAWLLLGTASYIVMRVWSGVFFIPEMLAFQKIPPHQPPTPALSQRVARWAYWSWFREPLDLLSFLCFLLALHRLHNG